MNTNSNRIEVRAQLDPWYQSDIRLWFYQVNVRDGIEHVFVANAPDMTELGKDTYGCEKPGHTMSLTTEDAQRLMDELYRVGVRPTEGAGSTGQLAAVKEHLADMRKLVFEKPTPVVVRHRKPFTDEELTKE
jgi:hypothetical protein